jgi:hypothetical protein
LTAITLVFVLTAAIIQASWMTQSVPLLLRVVPAVLLVVTTLRPQDGLLFFSGVSPLSSAIVILSGWGGRGEVLLEQLVLATIVGTAIHYRRAQTPMRLPAFALVTAAIAAASAIATTPILALPDAPGVNILGHVRSLVVDGAYFERTPTWVPLQTAMWLIEGLAVAVAAERIVRDNPSAARRVLVIVVLSVTAIAVLNLERLVGAAIRSGDFVATFPGLLLNTRVSRFYDVNAMGSVFVLVTVAAVGLMKDGGRSRAWTVAAILVLVLGLWSSGSRSALASCAFVSVAALGGIAIGRKGLPRFLAGASLLAMAVAIALVIAFYPATRISAQVVR